GLGGREPAEHADELDPVHDSPWKRDPHGHAGLAERFDHVATVLLNVGDDQIRLERADPGGIRVLLAADLRHSGHLGPRLGAEDRDADDPVAEPEREEELGHARYERDDAARTRRHGHHRAARVARGQGWAPLGREMTRRPRSSRTRITSMATMIPIASAAA